MRKNWVVCLLAMVCCALWGSAFPCIKVGYRLFQIDSADTATQILFAGCRFTIAGIMVILFGSILQGRFLKAGKGDLPRIGKICLLQTVVQYFFFYVGLAHTTGVKGSIVEASNVFLAILVSSLIFHQEKLDQKKVLGCIVGFAGVFRVWRRCREQGKLHFPCDGLRRLPFSHPASPVSPAYPLCTRRLPR